MHGPPLSPAETASYLVRSVKRLLGDGLSEGTAILALAAELGVEDYKVEYVLDRWGAAGARLVGETWEVKHHA